MRPHSLPTTGLLLFGLLSCAGLPPEALALTERPTFRTPADGARSFLAAIATDNASAEYLCFSEALKQKHGATLDAYLLARPTLLKDLGQAQKHAFDLRLHTQEEHPEGTLLWWSHHGVPYLGLVMTAQHYYDLEDTDGRRIGNFLPQSPGNYVQMEGRNLRAEINDSGVRSGPEGDALTRFEVGTEWKIADILSAEDAGN